MYQISRDTGHRTTALSTIATLLTFRIGELESSVTRGVLFYGILEIKYKYMKICTKRSRALAKVDQNWQIPNMPT